MIRINFHLTHDRGNCYVINLNRRKRFFLSLKALLTFTVCQFILHNLWECIAYSGFNLIFLDIMLIYSRRFCLQFNIIQGFIRIDFNIRNRFCHISPCRHSHIISSRFHFYRKVSRCIGLCALIADTHICTLNRMILCILNKTSYCIYRYRFLLLKRLSFTICQKLPAIR